MGFTYIIQNIQLGGCIGLGFDRGPGFFKVRGIGRVDRGEGWRELEGRAELLLLLLLVVARCCYWGSCACVRRRGSPW